MGNRRNLLEQIDRIQQVRGKLDKLASKRPDGWQKDYASTRLAMQEEMSIFDRNAALVSRSAGDKTPEAAFCAAWARFKSGLATHQARWPIILMKTEDRTYRASVAQVDANLAQLIAAIRSLPAE